MLREPLEFAAGDTLSFSRHLPDYPATDGWSLLYELRGGTMPIEFTSTASGADHALLVPAVTTGTWPAGEYVIAGFAVKGDERHQVYYGTISIREDLQSAPGDAPVKTFAQKMVETLQQTMLAKAGDDLAASQLGDTRFQYMTFEELHAELGRWTQIRRQEVAAERAKQGLPTGNKIRLQLNVVAAGTGYGVVPFATH